MRGLRNLFVLGGIAMSLALPQMALSADGTGAASQDKAKIDETKPHERGFAFTPQNDTGAVQTPAATGVKKADVKKAIENVAQKKDSGSKVAKTHQSKLIILTAVKKTKSDNKTTATAVAHPLSKPATGTASGQPGENTSMLVKFSQNDGSAVISARLDRNGTLPVYKLGDKLVVNVKANQDCNVVVFNYDSTGTLTQIFPNDYQPNGFVKSGDVVEIGGPASPFDYQIAGKGGPEKVFVYAYPTGNDFNSPLTAMGKKPAQVAMAPIPGTPFRGAEMTVDEYRQLVNGSQVFFARSVEVKPKTAHSAQTVSSSAPPASPNKVELTFTVEK